MDQAKYYVEDIWHAGVDSSQPFIRAYVVGDRINSLTGKYQAVGNTKEEQFGEVKAMTFNELVRTAEARLFALKEKIEKRYSVLENDELVSELLELPAQQGLDLASGEG